MSETPTSAVSASAAPSAIEPASGGPLPPASTLPPPLQHVANFAPSLARVVQFGWRLSERWNFDKCPLIAAAMAFFGLLSLFPIMLAAAAIFGKYLAAHPQLRDNLLRSASGVFPGASLNILEEQIKSIGQAPNSAAVGVVSVVSLLWSGRAFFDTLASVLNSIWLGAKPRTWWQHQVALWSTLLGAGLLCLLSTAVTFGLTAARSLSDALPDLFINRQPLLWNGLARLSTWLLTTFMFWLIYRFLPNAQPGRRGRIALGSALVAAAGWEIAKWAFTHYLGNATRYGNIYGGVAGVVLTMMWLYFSSMIILLGAEAAAAYQETWAAAVGAPKPTRDHPADEGEALPEVGPAAAPTVTIRVERDEASPDQTDREETSSVETPCLDGPQIEAVPKTATLVAAARMTRNAETRHSDAHYSDARNGESSHV